MKIERKERNKILDFLQLNMFSIYVYMCLKTVFSVVRYLGDICKVHEKKYGRKWGIHLQCKCNQGSQDNHRGKNQSMCLMQGACAWRSGPVWHAQISTVCSMHLAHEVCVQYWYPAFLSYSSPLSKTTILSYLICIDSYH